MVTVLIVLLLRVFKVIATAGIRPVPGGVWTEATVAALA